MDITVAKKDLLRLVSRMQGVAERKSTMPALANVLLAVEGPSALKVGATDMYLALSGRIAAQVSKGGSVAVPAKDLLERIKMMPDGPLHVVTQENATTVIKAAGSPRRYTLRGMPGEEFPPLPTAVEGSPSLGLEVEVLRQLIARTSYAVSTDETRAHLNSALFEWDGDVLRMVTTDGHRLSKMESKAAGRQASTAMLIPLKAVHELRRMCDEAIAESKEGGKPPMQVIQSGSSAFFHHGGTTFSVKLVDAQFPPYAQVIPQNPERRIRVARGPLAEALKAVSIAASERTGGVKLSFGSGSLRISSESPESGEGFDELSVDYDGPNISVGFNAKYFLDVLNALEAEEVTLSLSGELDPAVIQPSDDTRFLAVVMPMRI